MSERRNEFGGTPLTQVMPNGWDFFALLIGMGLIILVAWGAKQMAAPYHLGQLMTVSLNPTYLPYYALRTVLRLFIALGISLVFAFVFGTLAAKNKHAERLIIPLVDIFQSVPVLSFLSITVTGFIALFHGSLLGPEAAAIFAIVTSQAWNITLSLYQSIRTVPEELRAAAKIYHLSPWQQFWRVEVPFSTPNLLWNTMISMSSSWFFVVASEAITVSHETIFLPGIGSYIAEAIRQSNGRAILYAIAAMFLVILVYDQCLFRPLVQWAEKFKASQELRLVEPESWLVDWLQQTQLLRYLTPHWNRCIDFFINFPPFCRRLLETSARRKLPWERIFLIGWYTIALILIISGTVLLYQFIFSELSLQEAWHVVILGGVTGLRVFAVILICLLVWIPIGIWIGQHPGWVGIIQPIAQFLAAFPAYLLFSAVVYLIVKWHLNPEIWVTPLLLLGTQWYVLFNVISGTAAISNELYQATDNLGVRGWMRWRILVLPAIFPQVMTGILAAAGGAWNTSIVAEVVSWGHTTLPVTGLGAYIAEATVAGNLARVALGTVVMCFYVLCLNRILWRPLYVLAETRYCMESAQ